MISQSCWVLVASTIAVALLAGCASPEKEAASSEGALSGDSEPAMGLLLRCHDAGDTTAELSIEKDSEGSRVTLLVEPLKGFVTMEYRGSDVRAVRELGAGNAVSFLGVLLSESGRRDTISVRPSGATAKLTVESAQHGSLELDCSFVD